MTGRVLGVVLAGGRSTRFGGDKALAEIGGESLLERAVKQLVCSCAEVTVTGRDIQGGTGLPDWPRPGMGPLGGIAAGLRHARETGFDMVLTCGVDSVGLPEDLFDLLSPAPSFIRQQPVIGLWPVTALLSVEAILAGDGRHSMLAFAWSVNARAVRLDSAPANINSPEDLAEVERRLGL